MKTIFTLLMCSVVFGSAIAQNMDIEVAKTATPIVIDGLADDAWESVSAFEIDQWGEDNPIPDPTDFAARFKMLWDDDYLYFLCTLEDDILMGMADCEGVVDWEVDNIEFYWSPGNSYLDDMTELTQVRLSYANAGSENPVPDIKNGWSEGGFTLPDFINAAIDKGNYTYTIEFSVDLAVSATAAGLEELAIGDTVGSMINACDNDNEDARKHIGGIIEEGVTWNQADTLLRLVLSEGASSVSNSSQSSVEIFPNPASNMITVADKQNLDFLEIINLQGQTIFRTSDIQDQISIAHLKNGMYFIRVWDINNTSTTVKLIKE